MSCLNPTTAWQDLRETTKNGRHPVIFSFKELDSRYYWYRYDDKKRMEVFSSRRYRELSLPCGKCLLCRKSRSWEITVRALLELRSEPNQEACFITLTVDDEHMSEVFPDRLLLHRPWQLFAKRLRKEIGSFRFMMCGEYGEHSKRPHYHACIFGHDLTERVWNFENCTFIDSPVLLKCWKFGQHQCRPVNENAIAYVAGYQLKLDDVEVEDGVTVSDDVKLRNYVRWSRNPGLGLKFLEKYPDLFRQREKRFPDLKSYSEISPSIIVGSKERFFDGRYFKEKLRLISPEVYDKMCAFKESRVFQERLHGPSYDQMNVALVALMNRDELLKIRLAKRRRDVVA